MSICIINFVHSRLVHSDVNRFLYREDVYDQSRIRFVLVMFATFLFYLSKYPTKMIEVSCVYAGVQAFISKQ